MLFDNDRYLTGTTGTITVLGFDRHQLPVDCLLRPGEAIQSELVQQTNYNERIVHFYC